MKSPVFFAFLVPLFIGSNSLLHESHKKNIRVVQRHFALHSRLGRQGATWQAGENSLTDKDPSELRILCGAIIPNERDARRNYHPPPLLVGSFARTTVPDQFDASKQWPRCQTIKQVRQQGHCGSCWAFAAAGVISDRYCIASGGTKTKLFSPQDLLVCHGHGRTENICHGAILEKPYVMLVQSGVVSGGDYMSRDGCMPYNSYHGSASWNDHCPEMCTNPDSGLRYEQDKTYGSTWYQMGNAFSTPHGPVVSAASILNETVRRIQLELMARGPLTVGFLVYDDFMTYKSGVYQYVTGNPQSNHAMKLIGWGNENGTDYWLIVNSWGPEWGMNGLVKIIRGFNHLGIEHNLVTAMVDPGLKRPRGMIGKAG